VSPQKTQAFAALKADSRHYSMPSKRLVAECVLTGEMCLSTEAQANALASFY
jgi:hypothetical protein